MLPESLPTEKRAPFSWTRANPLGSLKLLRSHQELFGIAAVALPHPPRAHRAAERAVLYGAIATGGATCTVGLVLAGVGVCAIIVQGGLVRPMVSALGERARCASGCSSASSASRSTAWRRGLDLPRGRAGDGDVGPRGPFGAGDHDAPDERSEQGQLQGAIASLPAIAGILGPPLFTQIFAQSIAKGEGLHVPGMPFYVAAAMLVLSGVIAWRVTRPGADVSAAP